jgi:hypothetical protein
MAHVFGELDEEAVIARVGDAISFAATEMRGAPGADARRAAVDIATAIARGEPGRNGGTLR